MVGCDGTDAASALYGITGIVTAVIPQYVSGGSSSQAPCTSSHRKRQASSIALLVLSKLQPLALGCNLAPFAFQEKRVCEVIRRRHHAMQLAVLRGISLRSYCCSGSSQPTRSSPSPAWIFAVSAAKWLLTPIGKSQLISASVSGY